MNYRQYLVTQGYTSGTIASKPTIVSRLYQAAVNKGLIATNPAAGIKAPIHKEDPASRINFLEPDQLQTLLGYINTELAKAKTNKQKLTALRDRVLIGIMSLQGCRTVEMHQLQAKDIVRQGDRTGLQVSAKRASRIVPLTENLTTQLNEYLQTRSKVLRRKIKPDSYLFVSLSNNNKGKQLSRRGIRDIIDRYLIACNLKYQNGKIISAHSLRHTAGTLALRSGAELRQVQDLLGHSDPRTTSIYAHVADRWEYNPGDNIEKMLENKSGIS